MGMVKSTFPTNFSGYDPLKWKEEQLKLLFPQMPPISSV
jgi:hypothetical protein